MDYEETMVENEGLDTGADDALIEGIEEVDESNEETLESLTANEDQPAEEVPPQEQKANAPSEPGYIKRRINDAVDKALARQKSDLMAEMEAKYAPIRDRLLEMDAKELVRQGEFKSVERAKEYLQLKQGIAPAADSKPAEQPRNAQGQFAPKDDPGTKAKIDMLAHQAKSIKARSGIDVMAEFNANEEIKAKVISGEMDFYDVAEQMKQPARKRPPAPMRSPNGASGANDYNAIDSMSDEQFARMEKNIAKGARYKLG